MAHRALIVAFSVALYFSVSGRVYSQQAISQTVTIGVASQSLQFQQALSSLQAANAAAIGSLNFQTLPQPAPSASQLALVQKVASLQPQFTITPITEVTIPVNASEALANLYAAKAALFNEDIAKYNAGAISNATKAAAGPTADERAAMQLAASVASEQPSAPVSLPQAPALPSNISPTLQAYILKRNQLMQEELQVYNQYISSDQATRQSALDAGRKANASQFVQLQQMTQNLSSSQN